MEKATSTQEFDEAILLIPVIETILTVGGLYGSLGMSPNNKAVLLPCLRNTIISPFFCNHFIGYNLQVRDRIVFKILLLVFHCLKGSAPHYNISLVQKYTPVRSLRSHPTLVFLLFQNLQKLGVNEPLLMPFLLYGINFL